MDVYPESCDSVSRHGVAPPATRQLLSGLDLFESEASARSERSEMESIPLFLRRFKYGAVKSVYCFSRSLNCREGHPPSPGTPLNSNVQILPLEVLRGGYEG